ncbi:MAG: glycosyltransferase [Oscillospiraceae bacterium]|nr:glycosyltransferase [Oscillospiraceae bacterium]
MHIIYAVTTCSDRVYQQLFGDVKVKPAFQSQKYHRLLIEGLAKGAKVDVVANPPVNRSVLQKNFVQLPREEEGGACYRYIPAIRNPILKAAAVGIGTFFKTLFLIRKDSAVIVDGLNRVTALSAMLAARLRGRPCVGIVTDLPDMLGGSRFSKEFANFVIRHCTHYVFLTEAMNDYLNKARKPYVILEGHSDVTMKEKHPALEKKSHPRICFYAGGVSRQYGLKNLVDGFRAADVENAALHIYGPGDYVEELEAIAKEDPRVFYGGMLMNQEIVDRELEATLLVNPRPTEEEYVKYSFPSKTMEYMASGTAVLTTVLPGMPKEYHPYVYLLSDETAEGIAKTLKTVLSLSDEVLFDKGMKARAFVLEQKNNVIQAQKILEMLKRK